MDVKGTIRNAKDVQAADRLIKFKQTKPLWEVVDEVIKIWSARHPEKYKSHLVQLKDVKETRRDKKFAATKSKSLRYLADVPQDIIFILRKLYTAEELPMNKEFFKAFAKRYSTFRVAEKI